MSEYSVEEVRACLAEFSADVAFPREEIDIEKVRAMLIAYAERIKADENAVTADVVQKAVQAFATSLLQQREEGGSGHHKDMRAALLAVWPNPPAQAAQVGDWRVGMFERWREAAQEKGYAGIAEAITAAPTANSAAQVGDNAALVEAMKLPDGYEVVEHLPGIWGFEYDRDDGERMASSASWNHPALAAIGAWQDHVEALAESVEPVTQGEAGERINKSAQRLFTTIMDITSGDYYESHGVDVRIAPWSALLCEANDLAGELSDALAVQPHVVPDAGMPDANRFHFIVKYNWIGAKTRCEQNIQDGDLDSARRAVDAAMLAAAPSPGESA